MSDTGHERILLITWNYPPKVGGMEQLLFQLVQEIQSEVKVDVVAPYSNVDDRSTESITVYRPRIQSLVWFFFFALRQGIKLLSSNKYLVVFGGSALVSPVIFLLGMLTNRPTVVYAHGLDLIYQNPIYQRVIQFVMPKMDLVLTNSSQTKQIAEDKGVLTENTSVIHPGIFSNEYKTDRSQTELKSKYNLDGHKVLLYVGRLAKRKGVQEFVKSSLPEIVDRLEGLIFCVVGGDPEDSLMHKGNMRDVIKREADKQNIADHVRLFDWVERDVLLDMYALCDVFVLPAIHIPGDMEGFGIVLAEANAAGKPVVSSRIGGIPDAVQDGKSAILVQPEDWKAFTKAILELLGDEVLRKEMGVNGQEFVSEELDWQVIGNKFLRTIRAI